MSTTYTARHLGFDYSTGQHTAELEARCVRNVTSDETSVAVRGKHAAYAEWNPGNPEARPGVELAEEVAA